MIYCGTAHRLAELKIEVRAELPAWRHRPELTGEMLCATTPFSEIRYPPVASVVLGFRREDVAHPCQGYGMLIPKIEGFKILGTIFSSSLFPNRAPAGHLTLTSYIGGERHPELALLPPEKLVELTCEDLRVLLGVKGRAGFPALRALSEGDSAIQRRLRPLPRIDERNRNQGAGLFFAGHYRDGVSLGDSIVSGCNIAERVGKFLSAA